MLGLAQGTALCSLARKAISSRFSLIPFRPGKIAKEAFSAPAGCYVFLYLNGRLRGSAGVAETFKPLHEELVAAAQNAAFRDPRYPPLKRKEVKDLVIEVNVLTKPKRVDIRNPEDYLKHIRPGKDGLLIKGVFTEGLLLPQAATQNRWDALAFLRNACLQAQLQPDDWQDFDKCRVYVFDSQIFSETAPGQVVQIK
ncbi:MAG: AmmeMemoRadiSam system protein A [Nanoarchaeota archaeon]|nr:AmmeMemoRadiSam system protein A [Nanoarchaeota archaeon]